MKKIVRIENLDCANCAAKLERAVAKIEGVKSVSVAFMTAKMTLEVEDGTAEKTFAVIRETAAKLEPDWKLIGI
ncbi:MAG: heavy metal-associated domain-containing protein [Candidatus Borkfalkiaceae bacterium]|nr:heavy metal-associated domain-containing protein [Christensenellaceae bacterium]